MVIHQHGRKATLGYVVQGEQDCALSLGYGNSAGGLYPYSCGLECPHGEKEFRCEGEER